MSFRLVTSDMGGPFSARPPSQHRSHSAVSQLGDTLVPASGGRASVVELPSRPFLQTFSASTVISYSSRPSTAWVTRCRAPEETTRFQRTEVGMRDLFGRNQTFGVGVHIYQCGGAYGRNLARMTKRYLDGHIFYQNSIMSSASCIIP